MDADIASTGQLYSLLGWIDKNRKQLISTAVILVVAGVVIGFVVWRAEQRQIQAGEALSAVALESGSAAPKADALMKVADDFAGTEAGGRALLTAAGQQFTDGKIADAQASFEKFVAEYADNSLVSQAKLGIAVCLEAQNKTAEATTAYKEVVDRYPGQNTAIPAKFYLAGLYETGGKLEMARDLYMDLAQDSRSTFGTEAIARLTAMFQKDPSLRPGAKPAMAPSPAAPATSTSTN